MAETPGENEPLNLFAPGAADQLALSLEDLLPDANGNVVLFNDAGVTEMSIVTARAVVETGIAGEDAAPGAADVAGMAYYSFDSGPTLYCPMDVHVSIVSDHI